MIVKRVDDRKTTWATSLFPVRRRRILFTLIDVILSKVAAQPPMHAEKSRRAPPYSPYYISLRQRSKAPLARISEILSEAAP
jgi:hypothetical protein